MKKPDYDIEEKAFELAERLTDEFEKHRLFAAIRDAMLEAFEAGLNSRPTVSQKIKQIFRKLKAAFDPPTKKQYSIAFLGIMTVLGKSEKEAREQFATNVRSMKSASTDLDWAEIHAIDYVCDVEKVSSRS